MLQKIQGESWRKCKKMCRCTGLEEIQTITFPCPLLKGVIEKSQGADVNLHWKYNFSGPRTALSQQGTGSGKLPKLLAAAGSLHQARNYPLHNGSSDLPLALNIRTYCIGRFNIDYIYRKGYIELETMCEFPVYSIINYDIERRTGGGSMVNTTI